MAVHSSFASAAFFFALAGILPAQTLQKLVNQPPDGAGIIFQLTDGSVMTQGNGDTDWYKLTPDLSGSYVNGTWTKLASLPSGYVPDAFSSAVLADGRLLIEGGEYNQGFFSLTNMGAIYDPQKNSWTMLQPPPHWGYIGDSPSTILPNGMFLIGRKLDKRIAVLDPTTLQWTELSSAGKSDFNAEEGWTLMPDGSVLTCDVLNAPNSERYLPGRGEWISDGSTIVDLHAPSLSGGIPYGNGLIYYPPGEVGPAILRPDGTVYATGASNTHQGHSAIYHPGANASAPGTWEVGPDFPHDDAGDSSAALLPSGNVLIVGTSQTLYEFNGTTLTPGARLSEGSGHYLMMLPTGQAIVTGSPVQVYNPAGAYSPSWAPAIAVYPRTVVRGSTYPISGTQFNGLSQAAAFGDEFQTATNYPLVRLTNTATGHVFFARTHDHSTMGVATGAKLVSTNFDVPANAETGAASLEVIANGIPSAAVSITVN